MHVCMCIEIRGQFRVSFSGAVTLIFFSDVISHFHGTYHTKYGDCPASDLSFYASSALKFQVHTINDIM